MHLIDYAIQGKFNIDLFVPLTNRRKFVELVKNYSVGEKNGPEIGTMFFIVVKDVERIR